MRDLIAQQLIEQATKNLRPADTKVFLCLAANLGEFKSGEAIAREIYPDKDWSRARNPLQLSIHQLRLRLGTDVIETRDSTESRGASYAINTSALETYVLTRQFARQSSLSVALATPVAATLDIAGKTDRLTHVFFWGPGAVTALLDLSSKIWNLIDDPVSCEIRLCIPAGHWKKAVQLVSRIEAASGLSINDVCRKCASRFGIFITSPMLGSGQIKGFHDESLSTAEILTKDNQTSLIDLRIARDFVQELRLRWTYSEASNGTALITCDVKDVESKSCRASICDYYTELTDGATAESSLLIGGEFP